MSQHLASLGINTRDPNVEWLLAALGKGKGGKGKGKNGKGKGNCYNCGEPGHFAR